MWHMSEDLSANRDQRISYDYHEQLQNHLSVYDCSCAKLLRKCDIWVASEHGFGEEAVVARRAWHHVPAAVSPTKHKHTLSGSKDGWQTTNCWLLGSYKRSSICHVGILMRNSSLHGSSKRIVPCWDKLEENEEVMHPTFFEMTDESPNK